MSLSISCFLTLLVTVVMHRLGPGKAEADIWKMPGGCFDCDSRRLRQAAFTLAYLFLVSVMLLEAIGVSEVSANGEV